MNDIFLAIQTMATYEQVVSIVAGSIFAACVAYIYHEC